MRTMIHEVVWQACDTFRGTIDPAQYKEYILTMLFVKYLSDLWKERKAYHTQKHKGKAERIERALQKERFRLPEEATFDHLFAHRHDTNLGGGGSIRP